MLRFLQGKTETIARRKTSKNKQKTLKNKVFDKKRLVDNFAARS